MGGSIHKKNLNQFVSSETLREQLSPEQFSVLCENDTEAPFKNQYFDHSEAGIYVDPVTGEPLFSSLDKYDSGCGWPSFTKPIKSNQVYQQSDMSKGYIRQEVRSKLGNFHLGHVFNDGPTVEGTRYCINSLALRFVPLNQLEKEGYGEYIHLFQANEKKIESILLGAGCFWGVEHLFKKLVGVVKLECGYAGGTYRNPTYQDVCNGETGHAEVVKVSFDPNKLTIRNLLIHFWCIHDPTTVDQQGPDVGNQYRSAIYATTQEQLQIAEETKNKLELSGYYEGKKVVTEIKPAHHFYPAEDHHQDYYDKTGKAPYCHFVRNVPKTIFD